ncbi:hypothetical protein DFP72DRAFT_1091817 [Ephemerocybe angulata]|uniref:Glucose receptor Git3 N-terminal domain-containing protein n=1 Tax=Ephemerocybe angulata TaxID=980116 RepID=A0A8H6HE43_9AGAR|nr:hypothetical protein DFP72DRAFT_1091817 [Tulosesus angulatus]
MESSTHEPGPGPDGFPWQERVSMLFIVEAGSLSGMSIMVLFAYKLYRTALQARHGSVGNDACDASLFLSLMLGEALRATGKIMTVRWIKEGTVLSPTAFCTTQGMVQLLGTNIIDWSTLAITIQTWVLLVVQWNAPKHFATYLTLGVWAIVVLIVGTTVGLRGLDIIGPTGWWCWITEDHKVERITSTYLWMWIILVINIVCYAIAALVIRGYLARKGHFRFRWVPAQERQAPGPAQAGNLIEQARREMAIQLASYPLVYFACVLPFSITRWMEFSGHEVAHQAAAFTNSIFSLSGLFNVILFFKTRPDLITGGDIEEPPQTVELQERPVRPRTNGSEELAALARPEPQHYQDGSETRGRPQSVFDSASSSGNFTQRRQVSRSGGTMEDEEDEGHLPAM